MNFSNNELDTHKKYGQLVYFSPVGGTYEINYMGKKYRAKITNDKPPKTIKEFIELAEEQQRILNDKL